MHWVIVDVVGFYFLDLARSYVPPPELEVFLYLGEPPIYVGSVSLLNSLGVSNHSPLVSASARLSLTIPKK